MASEGPEVQCIIKSNKGRPNMNEEIKALIQKHYEDDDVSWQAPGMKDFVLIRKDGEKTRVQKKYLLTTLEESYELFKVNNHDANVGFSKFKELRPPHIFLRGKIPQNVCVCKIHENVRGLITTLTRTNMTFPEFTDHIVCDQGNENCMFGNCKVCPGLSSFTPSDEEGGELCEWDEWVEANKITQSGTRNDCFNALQNKIPDFLRHTFKNLRENVGHGTIILQMDFSENYTSLEQNAIQAAHWCHQQLTVFTACAWFKEAEEDANGKCQSFACVSSVTEHDKYFVHCAIDKILMMLSERGIHFNIVHFFTDGAASQFKQRYSLCNMTFHIVIEKGIQGFWHFFATSHGKGAVDGVGGEVKRHARLAALSGKRVQSVIDFYNIARDKCKKVNVCVIEESEIEKNKPMLDKRWDGINGIVSIQKMHYFETVAKNVVNVACHSQCNIVSTHEFKAACLIEKKSESRPFETHAAPVITKDEYYAVYFDKTFYIGRVLNSPWLGKVSIKFLHSRGNQTYGWPGRDDICTVKEAFIFCGPLTLIGTGPFHVDNHDKILTLYKALKQKSLEG